MKKILIAQGGRANGNTSQLARAFMAGASEAGHAVELVSLDRPPVNGCLGCNACRYQKPCIQKDGFNAIRAKIESADCLVFASPLLFWTISARLKAFVERFYCLAAEDPDPPLGRYERYPELDCALLMTSADNFFWTFSQAVAWYRFAIVNYIGFRDLGMLLAGGCGDTNGPPRIERTEWLEKAHKFGLSLYGSQPEKSQRNELPAIKQAKPREKQYKLPPDQVQGFIIATPVFSKCFSFRVTMVKL